MSKILVPMLQRLAAAKVKKRRELSLPGSIKVKVGDKVQASDTVASAEFPGEVIILKIAEQLSVEPQAIEGSMRVSVGDPVSPGQILCEHRGLFGLFKNTFAADFGGKVEFINKQTGHLGLRLPSQVIELKAYIAGEVVEVEPEKAVVIETSCTYVQGIFGLGGENHGRLKRLAVRPGEQILEKHIPDDCVGAVLFGGNAPRVEALKKAADCGAAGLITASIDDSAMAGYLGYDLGIALTGNEKVPMTLIITEGFGRLEFSKRALELLTACQGRECSINGATQVRAGALRPEIIIPLDEKAGQRVEEEQVLVPGKQIRIIREPYFGIIATISELPVEPQIIETGARVRVLKAKLSDQKEIVVPRANVELV